MTKGFIVRQSHLFGAPLRHSPKDAETVSHRLLVQGGFVHQLAAGIFSLLPLGFKVHQRVAELLRVEMQGLGALEIFLPSLQPKSLWEETGRWETIDPPLFTVRDRHDRAYALAPTHEEVITDLARTYLSSYRQLPIAVFQMQTKFRNEQRPTGGLLRTREFVMKDLYSFHQTEEDLRQFYEQVRGSYLRFFEQCGLKVIRVSASSGSIGGSTSHEFAVLTDTGEDRVLCCTECSFAANREAFSETIDRCPECGKALQERRAIESGHIFQLGDKYSRVMRATVADARGRKIPLIMGCYGIGLGRVLAAIVEVSHDDRGIIWPKLVAPFDVHCLTLPARAGDQAVVERAAEQVLEQCSESGLSVLYDDRVDARPGEKFADADLIGIPWRIVVTAQHAQAGTVGLKKRTGADESVARHDEVVPRLAGL